MKKKKIIIFGSSYHSKVVLNELLNFKNYKIIGFCDEKKKPKTIIDKELSLINLGGAKSILKNIDTNTYGIIGIGENSIRKKIVDQCKKINNKFPWIKLISKHAHISKNVSIGDGSLIVAGTTINNNTSIGKHCLINTSSSVDHDCNLKDYSSLGPGVTMGGNVNLGKLSFVGIGSTVKHKINIKENSVIGGHSYVNKDCKKNYLYFGVPIKKIKKRKLTDKQF